MLRDKNGGAYEARCHAPGRARPKLIWSDSVPDAAPLRAVEVEALVWSTMTIPSYARPWPPLANTNLAPLSRVESRKKHVLGWITVVVVLFGGALAALLGSAWLAV